MSDAQSMAPSCVRPVGRPEGFEVVIRAGRVKTTPLADVMREYGLES